MLTFLNFSWVQQVRVKMMWTILLCLLALPVQDSAADNSSEGDAEEVLEIARGKLLVSKSFSLINLYTLWLDSNVICCFCCSPGSQCGWMINQENA